MINNDLNLLTVNASNSREMTAEQREANKAFAAACSGCGGWTRCGGMSQFADGANGCDCHTSK